MTRLKETYKKEIAPALVKEFGLTNPLAAPKLKKVVINVGIGGFRESREAVESFMEELGALAGQKPYVRKARLSEAGFKIRKGMW